MVNMQNYSYYFTQVQTTSVKVITYLNFSNLSGSAENKLAMLMESPFFSWNSLSFWKAGSWVKPPLPSMMISQVFPILISSPWFSEGLFDTDWLWQNKSEFSKWEEGQKLRKNRFYPYLPDLFWCNAPYTTEQQLVMMKIITERFVLNSRNLFRHLANFNNIE